MKLVDAHDYIDTFFVRNLFRKLQDIVHIVCLGIEFQRDGKIRHRLRAQRNLGADPRKEQPGIFHPLLQFGRSLFEHSRRESIVKFPFATTRKNIQIDYFQRIRLSQTAHFTDQRCLPPTARRNQHRIHTMPEVGQQTSCFLLAVGKIVTRSGHTKNKWLIFHNHPLFNPSRR